MEEEVSDEICITIYFDNGNNVKISKSFLIEHSPYFEAMFCGKFMEAQSGDQIKLKVFRSVYNYFIFVCSL